MTARVWGRDAGQFASAKVMWSALNSARDATREAPAEVNLADLEMIKPYSLACVCAIGALTPDGVRLRLPESDFCRNFIVQSGAIEFFRDSERQPRLSGDTTVRVRQVTSGPGSFSSDAVHAWAQAFGSLPGGLVPRWADHLDEVIINALTHSGSSIGCIVAGQAYPTMRRLEVAVLDLGRTIKGHLTQNPRYAGVESDEEAVLLATEEGITGTPAGQLNPRGEPNSGAGLFELRSFCERGGGMLTILSGTAMVTFQTAPLNHAVHNFNGGFPGTLVNMQFDVNAGLSSADRRGIRW